MSMTCEICFKAFNDTDVLPKVLKCGHSFCNLCLTELLQTMKNCPTCRMKITNNNTSDFPTNFLVLALLRERTSTYINNPIHIKFALENWRTSLIEKRKEIMKNIAVGTTLKNVISADLSKVEDFLDESIDAIDITGANDLMLELTNDVHKVDEVINCHGNMPRTPRISFSLKQFKNEAQFLYQIAIQLYKEDSVFAMELVNGEPKFGKVTAENDIILVHSLTESSIVEVKEPKLVIMFEDFRKCMKKDNFSTFLAFSDYYKKDTTLFFSLTKSILTPQFIELCTGERGPTYKGSKFINGTEKKLCSLENSSKTFYASSIMKVEKYSLNEAKIAGPIHYDFSVFAGPITEKAYDKGKYLLVGYSDGSFDIFRSEYDGGIFSDVVGVNSDYPDNLLYCSYSEESVILDSGIAFRLN